MRRLLWLFVGLVLVAGLVLAFVLGAPRPRVEVAATQRGAWQNVVEEDGFARARERYVVSAPLAGVLERVTLHAGDCVKEGDVLATLHPGPAPMLDARSRAELEARRQAAEAGARVARTRDEGARAALAHAEEEATRARSLAERGSIATRDLEHAELELALARREREAARFSVSVAVHERDVIVSALESSGAATPPEAFVLKAPTAGCLLAVMQEDESAVAPGTPILTLADLGALEVVIDLLSTDAVRVNPGDPVTLDGYGSEPPVAGRVRRVEPRATTRVSALGVEERRVDVIIDPVETPPSWARVGDGYRVDASIVVDRVDDALVVPTSALFRVGDQWAAMLVEGDRVRRVEVALDRYGPRSSVVASGIAEGARVVVEPPDDLEDGARVEPANP
jgi:HlyD family secretion protein